MPIPVCLTGSSVAVREIDTEVTRIAAFDVRVLITGEGGVGKQTVARLIHDRGPRADRPFVTIDCGAIPDSTFESEGLAPVKDAGGTLLLRDVDEMSAHKQTALFRCLDAVYGYEGQPSSRRPERLRVFAASRGTLFDAVKAGTFRQDLFYRLNTIHICVPPLRERSEDVPVLFDHFLREIADVRQCALPTVPPETMQALMAYSWPDNVRELKHIAKELVVSGGNQRAGARTFSTQVQFESIRAKRPPYSLPTEVRLIGAPRPRMPARPWTVF